jgi:NAD(P)H-dependent FMN reductase
MAGQPLRIAIVTGSTRPNRNSERVAHWVLERARARDDADYALVDIAAFELPLLDEPMPPSLGEYAHEHTREWSRCVAGFDGFVFVTPEYNRSAPGALKNAIDFLYGEWHDKVAGFVSYGGDAGGARAVEHLRAVMAELGVADVRAHVALSLATDFEGYSVPRPAERHEQRLDALLDQVLSWGRALRTVREPQLVS